MSRAWTRGRCTSCADSTRSGRSANSSTSRDTIIGKFLSRRLIIKEPSPSGARAARRAVTSSKALNRPPQLSSSPDSKSWSTHKSDNNVRASSSLDDGTILRRCAEGSAAPQRRATYVNVHDGGIYTDYYIILPYSLDGTRRPRMHIYVHLCEIAFHVPITISRWRAVPPGGASRERRGGR